MKAAITLSKAEACDLLGVTTAAFDDWRRKGILPAPIPGTRRWSRRAIQHSIDRGLDISPADEADLALEGWINRRAS